MSPMRALAAFDPFAGCDPVSGARSYLVLDVFSQRPLEGNQLAVFTDGRGIDGARMQAMARELKLSETVFLLPPEGAADARVRIFTPTSELPFAGRPGRSARPGTGGARDRIGPGRGLLRALRGAPGGRLDEPAAAKQGGLRGAG
jgi:hypothetical protein